MRVKAWLQAEVERRQAARDESLPALSRCLDDVARCPISAQTLPGRPLSYAVQPQETMEKSHSTPLGDNPRQPTKNPVEVQVLSSA